MKYFTLPLWLVLLWFAGCATPKVDWNTRVGSYTYDQAVTELGPPDKQAKLTTGQTVAEWVSRYNSGSTVMIGTGIYNYPGGIGYVQSYGPTSFESRLRLTFGTNNVLSTWSKK